MDPLMVQLTQTIHEERIQNMAKRRYFNSVSNQPSLLVRLGEAITAAAQKFNLQSLSAPITSAFRS